MIQVLALQVWGRDDDGGGLTFLQQDIDKTVQVTDHRYPFAPPLSRWSGRGILSLCVSDINKQLLLNAEGFIPLLVDSLLLDPEHPRRSDGKSDFDTVAPLVQQVSDLHHLSASPLAVM